MRSVFTKLFWPILRFFESSEEASNYKQSYRVILIVVGALFLFLSLASAVAVFVDGKLGAFIPVVVFFCVGLVAIVVGALGSNSAVSKIWGTK